MDGLPADTDPPGEYHVLLVRHGREVCVARQPRCDACPLRRLCAHAKLTQPRSPAHP